MNARKKVLMGIEYSIPVPLDQYGGAIFRVHAVPDMELTKIEDETGYTIVEVLTALSVAGMSKEELNALQKKNASLDTLMKIAPKMLNPKMKKFLAALCRAALLPDDPDPECPNCRGNAEYRLEGRLCGCRDLVSVVDNFKGFSLLTLGCAALGASLADFKEVEDFFRAKKAQPGPALSASKASVP